MKSILSQWLLVIVTYQSTIYLLTSFIVGEYREGFMHGIGRFQYARGAVYEGSFRQDKRYGPDMLRGWAQKKGHVNPALKSRFFVLATGAINYYADLKDNPPFGVDLKGFVDCSFTLPSL